MKRQITFEFHEGNYVLKETDLVIFSVNSNDLKFDSLKFYTGVYKDKTPTIDLIYKIESDSAKKGNYIFNWIKEIVLFVENELSDEFVCAEDVTDTDIALKKKEKKIIPLYDFAACAGDGMTIDNWVSYDDFSTDNPDADFAVRISGHSMKPIINDGDIVLVKKEEEYRDKDICLLSLNGEVMCKRYCVGRKRGRLKPENTTDKFKEYIIKEGDSVTFFGRVLGCSSDHINN